MAENKQVSDVVGDLLQGIAGRMEDVAREAGVSYSALYSWATGRRRPGRQNLEKLAKLAEQRSEELAVLAGELRSRVEGSGGSEGGDGGGGGDGGVGGGGRNGGGRSGARS